MLASAFLGMLFHVNQSGNVKVALDYQKFPKGWFSRERSSVFVPAGRSCALRLLSVRAPNLVVYLRRNLQHTTRFTTELFLRISNRSTSLYRTIYYQIYNIERKFFFDNTVPGPEEGLGDIGVCCISSD